MKIIFTTPTASDRQYYDDLFEAKGMLDGRAKIIATDDDGNTTELFPPQEEVERLGHDYIRAHAVMTYNNSIDSWILSYSQNDYYNDTERNPEKVIKLKYCGDEGGTGREVYKDIDTGRYFLRENHYPREDFAKWYVCGKRRTPEDGDEPRANLIFECNGEREMIRYDDWNGVAAYSDLFNKKFTAAARCDEN